MYLIAKTKRIERREKKIIYTITGIFSTLLILLSLFFTYKRMKKPKQQNQEQVINQMQNVAQNQEQVIDEEQVVTDQQQINYLKVILSKMDNNHNNAKKIITNYVFGERQNEKPFFSEKKLESIKLKYRTLTNQKLNNKDISKCLFSIVTFTNSNYDPPMILEKNTTIYFLYIEYYDVSEKQIGIVLTPEEKNRLEDYFPNSKFRLNLNNDIDTYQNWTLEKIE